MLTGILNWPDKLKPESLLLLPDLQPISAQAKAIESVIRAGAIINFSTSLAKHLSKLGYMTYVLTEELDAFPS